MRQMKNSNTKWLGDIPADWKISRIGNVYTLRNTKVSDRDYEPLSVTMNGIVPQLEAAAKTNAHDDRKLVKKGDFVINSRSDRRGSCGISDRDGSVSLINTILCPNEKMNTDYYNWLFHTTQFADEFYANGHGIVDDLWTTGWQEMKRILIPLPPLEVQKSIANFLDQKCSEIDSLSTDIQSQINVLKEYKKSIIIEAVTKGLNPNVEMKDSGIEWIGEIPKEWDVIRIKDKYTFDAGFTPDTKHSEYYTDEYGFEWATIADVKNGRVASPTKSTISREYVKNSHKKQMPAGCLLYSFKLSVGETAITDRPLFTNEAIVCFYPSKDVNINFFKYSSFLIEHNANTNIYGAKILNQQLINNAYVVFPPLKEQKEIANYLDSKCREIDAIIADKKTQLETLAEYKKSLIYEYVTGKKEVAL